MGPPAAARRGRRRRTTALGVDRRTRGDSGSFLGYHPRTTTPPAKPATAPCPKCGRPLAVTAKRCLYCGTYRILAAPGTPEYEAEKAAADADAKKVERQKVAFQYGMGLGKTREPASLGAKLRQQTPLVRFLAIAILVPVLMMVWPPKAIRLVKDVFAP